MIAESIFLNHGETSKIPTSRLRKIPKLSKGRLPEVQRKGGA
jgi:hypothetical protein